MTEISIGENRRYLQKGQMYVLGIKYQSNTICKDNETFGRFLIIYELNWIIYYLYRNNPVIYLSSDGIN